MVKVIPNRIELIESKVKIIAFPLYSSYHDREKYSIYCPAADNIASYVRGLHWLQPVEVVLVPINVLSSVSKISNIENKVFVFEDGVVSKITVQYHKWKPIADFCEPIKKYLVDTYCKFEV
jgi:hypothetical protein